MKSDLVVSSEWKDYRLIDSGNGARLEQWGDFRLIRPDPCAVWIKSGDTLWEKPDAVYTRGQKKSGEWKYYKKLPESWNITYKKMTFKVRPTGFKHTGLFPEQAANWDWIYKITQERKIGETLNLFGYSGAASISAALAGSNVCHVDASKGAVRWCGENMRLSKADNGTIRLIIDDCMKFIRREERRNRKYEAIIMDPPAFGRGASGEVWKLEKDLWDLLSVCKNILSDNRKYVLINSYTTGLSPLSVYNIACDCFGNMASGGSIICGEIGLPFRKNRRVMPCGTYCRILF